MAEAKEDSDGMGSDDWEDNLHVIAEKMAIKQNTPIGGGALGEEEFDDPQEEKKESAAAQKKVSAQPKKDTNAKQEPTSIFTADEDDAAARARRERNRLLLEEKKKKRAADLQQKQKPKKLRCPIICIMGHVDTGKTLILDKLRKTNVQAGEAGGITQQIGATYFPRENLEKHLDALHHIDEIENEIPGFLVIDTPGHESFTNLRARGSNLCDMAVLVVDVMHSLEQQTLESIELLRQKNTPFCIALNKIDRLNMWKPNPHMNARDTFAKQAPQSIQHFKDRLKIAELAFNEEGLNIASYWENDSPKDTLSYVPTSAITGEGLSDLIFNLVKMG